MSASAPHLASRVRLPAGAWATVLDCLCARFPAVSRERWQARMAAGRVQREDGEALAVDAPHAAGLLVRYWREVAPEAPVPLEEWIVHADADLVVADKPHFLPVAPTGAWLHETLVARLALRLPGRTLVPLHRIDRGTAGLVLLSANPATRARYQALFRERRIRKHYEALAAPLPQHAFPLVRRSRLVGGEPFFRMRECDGEPNAESRIAVLDRAGPRWRYALEPVTGRKHQLRVHLAALGAPVENDPYYPDLAAPAPDDYRRPLALLARALEFVDPITGAARRYESRRELQAPDAR